MRAAKRIGGLTLALGLMATVTVPVTVTAARAEVPQVVADIPPVHSLVARVMDGVGEPALMVPPGASPHGYSMRPSEARALAGADIVVMIGGRLTPWLGEAAKTLAPDAREVILLQAEGTETLPFRAGHVHAGEEDHGGHDDHGHAEERNLDQTDPHAWLDPENGKAWLADLAETLAEADPEHAETYRANAKDGAAEIDAVVARLKPELAPVAAKRFVVFHDSYQYFEHRFGLAPALAIRLGDAVDPGPRRISELRAEVAGENITCAFTEPQFNPALISTVFENTPVKRAVLDPLGVDEEPGPGLYPAVLDKLGRAMADCLGSSGD